MDLVLHDLEKFLRLWGARLVIHASCTQVENLAIESFYVLTSRTARPSGVSFFPRRALHRPEIHAIDKLKLAYEARMHKILKVFDADTGPPSPTLWDRPEH